MTFHFKEIAKTIGININSLNGDTIITGISTDSRTINKGDLFIALSGDNFDGSSFISTALEKGASFVITDNKEAVSSESIYFVEDTRKAFLLIAGMHRSKMRAKVAAITGSVGKTTTKEMIACVLESAGKTLKTKANLNNEVGLSQMLLMLDETHDFAVLEIGVDGIGQMLPMTMAASPDAVIITNIGTSHLQAFKTRENIKKEKLSITAGLRNNGVVVLNADDEYLSGEDAVFYGIISSTANFHAENIISDTFTSKFDLRYCGKVYPVTLPAIGNHNILNSLAAIAVGVSFGIPVENAIKALGSYKTEGMRQKTVDFNGITIVEDCYNASPQSMTAAIETLHNMKTAGRRIAVLSDMLELGNDEIGFHKQIGNVLVENDIEMVFATGKLSEFIINTAKENGLSMAYHYPDKLSLADALKKEIHAGDIVWFKASRGMRLEDVINNLYKEN